MADTRKIRYKRILIAIAVLVGLFGLWRTFFGKSNKNLAIGSEVSYDVKRQDMMISVTESGSIKASNAVTIRSEVEGRTTIVSVVPEGTVLTAEDVANGKIILELDTSSTKQELNQQQIQYNSAMANLTDAKENLGIQKNQNESDIQQAKLAVKFALMDLQKYTGQAAADKLVQAHLEKPVDDQYFLDMVKDPNQLGGAAMQTYRELQASINLARDELLRAQNTLYWTKQLVEKNYVAKTELEADMLSAKRAEIEADKAKTALDLFVQYEFPKESHKFFSDFVEAERQLIRTEATARAQLAQAEAKLSSADATFALEKEKLERFQRQIAASIIKAPCPGLVVYATQFFRGSRSRTSIEVGREVMEREEIMSIPNTTQMAVDTKIHETNIDKIVAGQIARITVDAMPDTAFYGQVTKISPLPDQAGFMSNPDLKVYSTDVSLQGGDMLRPGMSAKVEIIIAQLKDVLAVPVQCVANRASKKICYVQNARGSEIRDIQTGPYNDKFVQVLDGLKEGDKVLLNPPRVFEQPQTQTSIVADLETMQMKMPVNGGPNQNIDGQTDERPTMEQTQTESRNRPEGFSPGQPGQQQDRQNRSGRPRTDSQNFPQGQFPESQQQPTGENTGQMNRQRPDRQNSYQENNPDGQRPQGQRRQRPNTDTDNSSASQETRP